MVVVREIADGVVAVDRVERVQRRRTVVDWRSGSASALDAFNPVYGDDAISYFPDDNHTRRLEQTGVYLQDLIDIDQWRFSLGLRQDWVSVTDKNP
ncbi:TonB-dependent receptor domain-containing protein, partial [Pseudomonas aeruginosa]